MLKFSFADCLGLSPVISRQFTLEMCVAAINREINHKKQLFWGSRSFKVIDAGTPGKLVSSACYDAQQVCVYVQPFSLAGLDDSSRNRTFSRGYPNLMHLRTTENSLNLEGQTFHR